MRFNRRQLVALVALALLWGGPLARAATLNVSAATDANWQAASPIRVPTVRNVMFGVFREPYDARIFTFTITRPITMDAAIDVSMETNEHFRPQLVIYRPESYTVGPILPIDQPPRTSAAVYPTTDRMRNFEPMMMANTVRRLTTRLTFDVPGKYYLAVYNASIEPGRWRLELRPPAAAQSVTDFLRTWWMFRLWSGTLWEGIAGMAVALAVPTAILWLIYRRRRPPPRPAARKKRTYAAKH